MEDLQEPAEKRDAQEMVPSHDGDAGHRGHEGGDIVHAGVIGDDEIRLAGGKVLAPGHVRVAPEDPEQEPCPHQAADTDESLPVHQGRQAAESDSDDRQGIAQDVQ